MLGNNHAHDFIRALQNHMHSAVSEILLDWIVFEIAIAAVDLQSLMTYVKAFLGGE